MFIAFGCLYLGVFQWFMYVTLFGRWFPQMATFANQQGYPILLGEFGVYEDVPLDQRVGWTRAMREFAEERNIGWCYWDFATTFRAYNIDRETWIHSMLSALMDD